MFNAANRHSLSATRLPRFVAAFVLGFVLCHTLSLASENPLPGTPETFPPSSDLCTPYRAEIVASDLRVPWGMVFLPDGSLLFSEREGKVSRILPGDSTPKITLLELAVSQGPKMGLMDVCLDPDFGQNHFVYLAYNYVIRRQSSGVLEHGLRIARFRLSADRLSEPLTLIEGIPASPNQTGCRLVIGKDRMLYISTGDAGEPMLGQRLDSLAGKILRLHPDGRVPTGNPFFGKPGARPEIWSYGHRNVQGFSFQPETNLLYASEHGPNGGDEINRIERGANFGWPVISHRNTKAGMTSPLLEVTPSIAPSGTLFYTGDAFPELKGKLLVGLLRGQGILRVTLRDGIVQGFDRLFFRVFGRLRTVIQSPEGYLYLATSQFDPPEGQPVAGYDLIIRIVPTNSPPSRFPTMDLAAIAAEDPARIMSQRLKNNRLDLEALIAVHCASCHGTDLSGSLQSNLLDGDWKHGATRGEILRSLRDGVTAKGMPSSRDVLGEDQMERLVDYMLQWQVAR